MSTLLAIFIGSGLGGVLRYALHRLLHEDPGAIGFPWATLIANVLGCLMIGVCAAAFASVWRVPEAVRLGVLVGVLGGFTTFSTFGRETIDLLHAGRYAAAAAYVLASTGAGLFAVWLGMVTTERAALP